MVGAAAAAAQEHSGGVDRGGRWARASATAPGVEAGGATTWQPTERPRRRPWLWSDKIVHT